MNSYSFNYATQNQRVPYPNYSPNPTQNPIQVPINNFNQAIPQYITPQPITLRLPVKPRSGVRAVGIHTLLHNDPAEIIYPARRIIPRPVLRHCKKQHRPVTRLVIKQ